MMLQQGSLHLFIGLICFLYSRLEKTVGDPGLPLLWRLAIPWCGGPVLLVLHNFLWIIVTVWVRLPHGFLEY